MPAAVSLTTERLVLRPWRAEDREPFAALNADPEVMRYFPKPLTRAESDAFVDGIMENFDRRGWGLWAVEVVADPPFCEVPFIGFVGLNVPGFQAVFTPCVEIGWRLAKEYWRRGYAVKTAVEALQYGFEDIGLDEIVSFTSTVNRPSQAVMEKIGMTHDPTDDFDRPRIEPGHDLERHVLYRYPRDRWSCVHGEIG